MTTTALKKDRRFGIVEYLKIAVWNIRVMYDKAVELQEELNKKIDLARANA